MNEKIKICVVGVGGVGGVLAANFARAGFQVTAIARGEHLKAIQQNGLTLITTEKGNPPKSENFKIKSTDDLSKTGVQDYVIIAVKGHDIAGILEKLPAVMNEKTVIVPVMNGIPWWYKEELESRYAKVSKPEPALSVSVANRPMEFLGKNSGDIIKKLLPGVIYISTGIKSPGVIDYHGGRRLMLGEIDGAKTERLENLIKLFETASMRPIATEEIKKEIWVKLWGNISFNPISVLTKLGMGDISNNPETAEMAREIMLDMQRITDKLGISLGMTVDERLEEGRKSGKHKTSMLQDYQSGKKLELEGIIGHPLQIANLLGVHVPAIESLYAKMSSIEKH